MCKKLVVLLFVLVMPFSSFAEALKLGQIQSELAKLDAEQKKIEEYIAQGADPGLFEEAKSKIQTRKKELVAARREAEKQTVAAKPPKPAKKVAREPAGNISIQERTKPVEEKKEVAKPEPTAPAPAQNNLPFRLGLMVDTYYTFVSTRPSPGTPIALRYYDINHNDFTVNLVELYATGSAGRFSYRVDLDFGDFAEQNTNDDISKHIGQANLTYDFGFSKPVTLTVGKMYTHVGFEVPKALENLNYSRALAFSFGGPFWHEGLAFNAEVGEGFLVGAYLYDRWDGRLDQNRGKTLGWRLGYKNDAFSVYYNGITGPERAGNDLDHKMVNEVNASWTVSDKLLLAADALIGSDANFLGADSPQRWLALVGYASYQLTPTLKISPRFEYFKDRGGAFFGTASSVFATTLTTSIRVADPVELRFEGRMDAASEGIFTGPTGDAVKNRYSFTGALLLGL